MYHPDREFTSRRHALEGGVHRGARGYRESRLNVDETVPWAGSVESVTEIDKDRVLAITRTSFRGKSSGVHLPEERAASIVTVRGGKIIRTEVYRSPEEALEAAGISE